ncbi:hypothetical protein O3P69_000052 [Scylla paramamosain]|uniref:Uncharacterized protein n=1 Tax=Scylla paramamosain TaxID=85552 RepID=A0AAW0UXB6_SCYPA
MHNFHNYTTPAERVCVCVRLVDIRPMAAESRGPRESAPSPSVLPGMWRLLGLVDSERETKQCSGSRSEGKVCGRRWEDKQYITSDERGGPNCQCLGQ